MGFLKERDPMKVATMTNVPMSEIVEQTRSVTDIANSCRSDGAMVSSPGSGGRLRGVWDHGVKRSLHPVRNKESRLPRTKASLKRLLVLYLVLEDLVVVCDDDCCRVELQENPRP